MSASRLTRLRCEHLVDPFGIDEPAPDLSGCLETPRHGARRLACRIRVAGLPGILAPRALRLITAFAASLLGAGATVANELAGAAPATTATPATFVPVFPGTEGFGAIASGGRDGRVIAVTNLHDSGPGSLCAAVDQRDPRTIVFGVSGTMALKSSLGIRNGDLTIAGKTAPGDGICLRDYSLDLAGASNVIIRYLRVRPGAASGQDLDAFGGRSGASIIVDHCPMSWSIDECVSIYSDIRDVTVRWCVISESLYQSIHVKRHHGFGGISVEAPPDTDGVGMPDAWEFRAGFDPNVPADGPQDKDGDGYTNLEEYLNETDANVFVDYARPAAR